MSPEQALKTLGLSDKETAIYLASLELGQSSVSNIAKKADLKRPTTYLVLAELQRRGLLNTATKGKRTLYGAEEPSKLLGLVAEKDRALRAVLPYLEAINNRRETKPRFRFYEGVEGLRSAYEEIFASKEIRYWGAIEALVKNVPNVLAWFEKISATKKPRTFDLLTDTPEGRAYAKRVTRPGYEIRFFPKDLYVTTDSALFDSKLAFMAFAPEPHGFIVEGEEMTKSFRSLWELAWRNATPYKK